MNRFPSSFLMIAGLLLLVLLSSIFFTVSETERAIKIRLGTVVETEYTPGLHMKLPFIESIRKFDRRILTLDMRPERVLTAEKKNVIVDSFVKWRIEDNYEYFVSTTGSEQTAENRLTQFIRNGVKDAFAKRTVQEVVSSERSQLMEEINRVANEKTTGLGIRIVDVRIKKVELPEDVRESVYQRMEKERASIAREIRSEGQEEAKKIRAGADRVRTETIAVAYKTAQQTRGEGDAESAKIYAEAYSEDVEFYNLYRSLTAYKKAFSTSNDVLLLQPDSEFFKYFNQSRIEKE